MLMSYGKPSRSKMRVQKEVANERYGCLLEEFNSFKQLANENVKSMYSRLNVLVNEINALGVKNIMDLNINRNILQSLRKPDYDLVKAFIYEKKLEELKPSHIVGDSPEGPLKQPGESCLKPAKTKTKHLSLKRTYKARPTPQ
jgi:hypothetical protein